VSPDFGGQEGEQNLCSDHTITQLSIAIGSNGFKYEKDTLQKSAYDTIYQTHRPVLFSHTFYLVFSC